MSSIISSHAILNILAKHSATDKKYVREILSKSLSLCGLNEEETSVLIGIKDPGLTEELFETARRIKQTIYGRRLVIFAPLYISNLCGNECLYCAFRADNRQIKRRYLSQEEIAHETEFLVKQGHKRILLVAGESYPKEGLDYILKAIATIYNVKCGNGSIRRINANIAPLTLDEFKALKETKIGTYQLFQETYHPETYKAVHLKGKKADYNWRISAPDRAMEAGISDLGTGVLFGLYDWRFEILALLQHAKYLENKFGVGPHTISVPRLEPAEGSPYAENCPYLVSDSDFMKIVAILRCAVPYTGIIMSTRETPDVRRQTFALGVSQISAGSRTDPGGYADKDAAIPAGGQFSLGDHRPLDEVIRDVASLGYIPSFCTACYRLGRTGGDFMDLAKPGDIKSFCEPNACATFAEYLEDYASPETRKEGNAFLDKTVNNMGPLEKETTLGLLNQIRAGKRDCYC